MYICINPRMMCRTNRKIEKEGSILLDNSDIAQSKQRACCAQ